MKHVSFLRTLFLISIIFCILINCESPKDNKEPPNKDKKKKEKRIKTDKEIIDKILNWAQKSNIYINDKLKLNKQSSGHNFYFFSADSKIPNNTLLLRVPYEMMLTQYGFDHYFKQINNKKWSKVWEKLLNITDSEALKEFSTKQLCYLTIMIQHELKKKKKGFFYKKFKEYLKLYRDRNLDNFPIFYDKDEKRYLQTSSFGFQLINAEESLNDEYYVINNVLNLTMPLQEEFLKYRVISLTNSIEINNTNYDYTKKYNETAIVPFLDFFNKAISSKKANAKYVIKEEKREKGNDNNSFMDYYLEVYTTKELVIGSEINLKWRPFPNAECLLYYGFVEEGNPLKPSFYVDYLNRKLRRRLYIPYDKVYEGVKKDFYEVVSEFYEPWIINAYRNVSLTIDRYQNKEEGPYELMMDNLNDYLELYNRGLTDGNINLYMGSPSKIANIKEILHMERQILEEKMDYLKNIIEGIQKKNNKVEDL